MKYISHSEKETKEIAKQISSQLRGGMIVCLYGELGAGKTTFVKGLTSYFEIKKEVTSPTFTLMNLYTIDEKKFGFKELVHIDTYRLKDEQELIGIGAEDYLDDPKVLSFVEWPEKITNLLKNKKVINIYIDHLENTLRKIRVE